MAIGGPARNIKSMTTLRPQLPTSGELLGFVLSGLRLRQALEQRLPERTLGRVLRGDPGIKPTTRREVVDALVAVVVTRELLAALELLPGGADHDDAIRQARGQVADAVAQWLGAWDAATGVLRASGPGVDRPVWAVLPWIRLFAIELAIRLAAYLAVRKVEFTEEEAAEIVAGNAFSMLLARYRRQAERLTRHDLSAGTGLWRSAIDEWIAGRSLPQSESIEVLAGALAEAMPALSQAEVDLHLRCAVGLSDLVRWLDDVCPSHPDGPLGFMPSRAESFVLEFTTAMAFLHQVLSEAPAPEPFRTHELWTLVLSGSLYPGTRQLLNGLLEVARDSYIRADIEGVRNHRWTERVLLLYRQLPSVGNREREIESIKRIGLAPPPLDLLLAIEEHSAWGRLSPNPFGWHFPTFPRFQGPADDGDIVLLASEEALPGREHIVAKRAMEADHLRGDPQEALAQYRRLVTSTPDDAKYRFWLGCALARVGETDAAVVECRIACAIDPKWSLPAVEVAIILSNAGRMEPALEAIVLAARDYEVDAHLASTHGRILMQLGRHEEATPWFRRVLDANPKHALAMHDLAHCLLSTGQKAEGRKWAKAAAHAGEPGVLRDLKAGKYGK